MNYMRNEQIPSNEVIVPSGELANHNLGTPEQANLGDINSGSANTPLRKLGGVLITGLVKFGEAMVAIPPPFGMNKRRYEE